MTFDLRKAVLLVSVLAYHACGSSIPESATSQYQASFDCNKASNYIEHSICENRELAELDKKLAKIYKEKKNLEKSITSTQHSWLKSRNSCANDLQLESCLIEAYQFRIKELSSNEHKNSISNTDETIAKLINSEAYKKMCSTKPTDYNSPFVEKFSVSSNSLFIFLICDEGAYQNSYISYSLIGNNYTSNLTPIQWKTPHYEDNWSIETSPIISGNFSFDEKSKTLEVTNRSNGAGTCGSVATYELSKYETQKEIPYSSARGESDCFAGIGVDDWEALPIQ